MVIKLILLFSGWLCQGVLAGVDVQSFPEKTWNDKPNPLASPYAEVGGKMSIFVSQYPKSFNYYLDNNVFCSQLFDLMYETLLTIHPITLKHEPGLASRWEISEDKKTFTFYLNPQSHWSDGTPLTAYDVLFTFHTIMKPEHLTGVHKVSLEKFSPPVVIDAHTIRFSAKEVHWRNLLSIGSFHILPKHAFEGLDFNKLNFEFPVVSALYQIATIKEGTSVSLKRRKDWWKQDLSSSQGVGNFDVLDFKFYSERENAFEAFKKGEIDLFAVYTSHRWVKQTAGEKFDNNWIIKQEIYNYNPVGFQGFAMNMRRPKFQDRRVRKALAHLINREKMNETIMHNIYFMHRSYFEDIYNKNVPCTNEVISFNKEKARELLHDAGWSANKDTGILEKDGHSFLIKFLTRSASSDKFLVIFKEDLKDIGIRLDIDKKDWAAWTRDMDEYNYDMTWASWGSSVWKDPEGMWYSKEADRPSGNNITGFKDQRVDALIEKQRSLYDVDARIAILREIDKIVYAQFPYVLLWNINYTRLLYWNKFGMPDTVLSKFGNESSAYSYWWYDQDLAIDLKESKNKNQRLPDKPYKIQFDNFYQ